MCSLCGCRLQEEAWLDEQLVRRLLAKKSAVSWTKNSLQHNAREMRAEAERCRKSCRGVGMEAAADYLAVAYDAAAKAFDDALDALVS